MGDLKGYLGVIFRSTYSNYTLFLRNLHMKSLRILFLQSTTFTSSTFVHIENTMTVESCSVALCTLLFQSYWSSMQHCNPVQPWHVLVNKYILNIKASHPSWFFLVLKTIDSRIKRSIYNNNIHTFLCEEQETYLYLSNIYTWIGLILQCRNLTIHVTSVFSLFQPFFLTQTWTKHKHTILWTHLSQRSIYHGSFLTCFRWIWQIKTIFLANIWRYTISKT